MSDNEPHLNECNEVQQRIGHINHIVRSMPIIYEASKFALDRRYTFYLMLLFLLSIFMISIESIWTKNPSLLQTYGIDIVI
jgi:hypothetical protein